MKPFSLQKVANVQALRPSLVELRGHPVALPAISSHEPLQRGCDQRAWLEKISERGLRHVVIPLNGVEEDSCVFARRHPSAREGASAKPIFDLTHRDEGFFARLQFLVQTADSLGIMLGFSLIDLEAEQGPFHADQNEQSVGFDELVKTFRRGHTSTNAPRRQKLEESLNLAVDWISAQLRGHSGMWVEVFRGEDTFGAVKNAPALAELEQRLTKRLAEALTRSKEDTRKARQGPWVVVRDGFEWSAGQDNHLAPFGVRRQTSAGQFIATEYRPSKRSMRRPLLCWMYAGTRRATLQRAALWRAVMRGCWPIVPYENCCWRDIEQIASFCRQWTSGGYLRPCTETLCILPQEAIAAGKVSAATDGAGRYFVYLAGFKSPDLQLKVMPGTYRFYWFDPATGRGVDHGDGIDGPDCRVPRAGATHDMLLVLDQAELPEPLIAW